MKPKNFLSLFDFSQEELHSIVNRSVELKNLQQARQNRATCKGRVLGMIFELSSTRTRVAFETAMYQLGGNSIFLSANDTQLGRGEPIEDTARVLSQMLDIVMVRSKKHETIEKFAATATVPVINGMSDLLHPCQLLADIQTYVEQRGPISGRKVAFVGDGYNMCHTYIEAAAQFDFELRVATPPQHAPTYMPDRARGRIELVDDPADAVRSADLVVTDVWSSMGHEQDSDRKQAFKGYQINSSMLDRASPECLFLHCLPAHRGEEVDEQVLDDPRSAVWEEAGNRLHSQKALIEHLLNVD